MMNIDGHACLIAPCGPTRWAWAVYTDVGCFIPVRSGEVRGTHELAVQAARAAIAHLARGPVRRGGRRERRVEVARPTPRTPSPAVAAPHARHP